MVLEKCRYGDLFDFLKVNGAVRDTKLLKFLFEQVCHGLNALHTRANLCHLDIKLDNVLVGENGTLKLCDFGLVQPVDADLHMGWGTDTYMAPEVLRKSSLSETYKGVSADIFSMGVLLFTLHLGMPPFQTSAITDRNYSLFCRNPMAFWRSHPAIKTNGVVVDEDLKELLTAMLALDGSKRPKSVAEVIQHTFFTKQVYLDDEKTNL